MAIKKYIINNINELCDAIECINNDVEKNISNQLITKTTLWYRGQANCKWSVVPSIQRNNRLSYEQVLSHSFYHGVRQISSAQMYRESFDKWVSMMQHYGLPTRLLDWSYSPLIALFFALNKYELYPKCDACITIIVPELLNQKQGFDPFIYPIDSKSAMSMLKSAFIKPNHSTDKVLACFSVSNDLRQYAQRSAFTIHDSMKSIYEICDYNFVYELYIPKNKKEHLKKVLDNLGITENFLFHDIEHVAKQTIHRHLPLEKDI
ncbi:MAG: FRG domain-containing protein [Oscillospiraceae bacterium]|nr:FRG domain-containing protein [Oscillospiraceae bacterium]